MLQLNSEPHDARFVTPHWGYGPELSWWPHQRRDKQPYAVEKQEMPAALHHFLCLLLWFLHPLYLEDTCGPQLPTGDGTVISGNGLNYFPNCGVELKLTILHVEKVA